MNPDEYKQIDTAVLFLERHLGDPVTPADMAARAGWSPWHFQRQFRKATGWSVMEYAAKRRLARAAAELLLSGCSVLDAALANGFGYEQSLIRAFRREFGLTPGRFRRNGIELPLLPRYSPETPLPEGLTLRHGGILAGRLSFFHYDENDAESVTIRLKREFLTHTAGLVSPEERLHSIVYPDIHRTDGAWFFLGYSKRVLPSRHGCPDEMVLCPHTAVSLTTAHNPSLKSLTVNNVVERYDQLFRFALTPTRQLSDSFRYTLMTPFSGQGESCRFSVNLPVTDFAS